ncbi:hypothetical protein IMZ48_48000 [Candidatus Bathyarchaeota archaeon]|nr:hypothetical protein [Candidatus Bathyarchaeota archaeon]
MSPQTFVQEDLSASYRLSYSSASSFVLPDMTGAPELSALDEDNGLVPPAPCAPGSEKAQ